MSEFFDALRDALDCSVPKEKCDRVRHLTSGTLPIAGASELQGSPAAVVVVAGGLEPGRPERPELVNPGSLPRRGLGSIDGRVALLHAIAHIEFNAINLALDAAWRFRGLPDDYYRDWISVAADEARHFEALAERLAELEADYGDLPAHDGLWQMAVDTAGDFVLRMALVPRVLEARGLDVTPGMIRRLESVGDSASVSILKMIAEEEERHVFIGGRWFRYGCQLGGLDPDSHFIELLDTHAAQILRPPINESARRDAGFSDTELSMIRERLLRMH